MEVEQIYGDLPILETDRLLLRKVTREDIHDMYLYGSDAEVAKYVSWDAHQSIEDTKDFIEFVLNKYENKQVAPWGIELKENGKFIGTIDFVWWQPKHKSAEIGYVLSKDYWSKGIMTEAAKKVIEFGFDQMDLVRIQTKCIIANTGLRRVMEKSGMSFEGVMRKAILYKDVHQDLRLYSIIKEAL